MYESFSKSLQTVLSHLKTFLTTTIKTCKDLFTRHICETLSLNFNRRNFNVPICSEFKPIQWKLDDTHYAQEQPSHKFLQPIVIVRI